MKKILLCAAMMLAVAAGGAWAATLEEINRSLDPDKNTTIYAGEYWRGIKGKPVTWQGTVYDVTSGGYKKYRVFVNVDKPALTYNVILLVKRSPEIARLNKGQSIKFNGYLHKYSWAGRKQFREPEDRKGPRQITLILSDVKIEK